MRKIPRGILLWTALALCGALIVLAMAWVTRSALAAEGSRARAEARADLEERTRLALWRMDAAGAAIALGENSRPPGDYSGGIPPGDPLFRLHFEIRQGGSLISPEAAARPADFHQLRQLLQANPLPGGEWSVLNEAAEAGENAWQAVPKEARKSQADNAGIRSLKGTAQVRSDAAYQSNFTNVEQALRAKTVDETVTNSILQKSVAVGMEEIGVMRAVRAGGEIFLLRQLVTKTGGSTQHRVQGVWLDGEILARRLLGEIHDLLPAATLDPLPAPAADDPLALISFPFHLRRNESTAAPPAALTRPLAAGWAAIALALAATGLLVHGVMRLSERRAAFVSAVTHELRTPLTTFRLYSEMLESDAVKPEKRGGYLRVLSREADRLTHLVENVLSFSQIERGSARSVVRDTTAAALLEPMRDRFEARLTGSGLTLKMPLPAEIQLRTDAAVVEHILFNLIDNAAKYAAGSTPPVVEIATRADGRFWEIAVIDHGPGIPPAERRRIFRAFHKSAREAAETRPGVGLGLALSRRLAKSLGGTLTCEGPAPGTRFLLRIPAILRESKS